MVEHSKYKLQKNVSVDEEVEMDECRLQTRLKQIAFGKNTLGYDNYIRAVSKHLRKGYNDHPRTPDPQEKQSKRCFDGKVKAWRRALHKYDPSASSSTPFNENAMVAMETQSAETFTALEVYSNACVGASSRALFSPGVSSEPALYAPAKATVPDKQSVCVYEEDYVFDAMGIHDYVDDDQDVL